MREFARLLVDERDGAFWVLRPIAGPFATNEAAWTWIDANTDEGRADTDRFNRIRAAFAGRGTQ